MDIFFSLLSVKIKVVARGCGAGALGLSRVCSATASLSFGGACSGPAEAMPAWSWELRDPAKGSAKPTWVSHVWSHAANPARCGAAPCQVDLLLWLLASLRSLSAWMCLSVCVTEQHHPNIACSLVVGNRNASWRSVSSSPLEAECRLKVQRIIANPIFHCTGKREMTWPSESAL